MAEASLARCERKPMANTEVTSAGQPDDQRYCCFMDILGFKSILNDFDRAIALYNGMADYIASSKAIDAAVSKEFDQHLPEKRDPVSMKILSDSIILSSMHWSDVVISAQTVQAYLFGKGILVRGGIAFGRHVEFAENLGVAVVSEALSRAYIAESKLAIYPRIIFDISALERMSASAREDDRPLLTLIRSFVVDDLGTWFMEIPFHAHEAPEKLLREMYINAGSEDLMRKIRWLVDYYNYCARRHSGQPTREQMRSTYTPAGALLAYERFGSLTHERLSYCIKSKTKGNLFFPDTWQ